jgi:tetratricopeptide (TPR) repeat protein
MGILRRLVEAGVVTRLKRRVRLDASPRSSIDLCRILLRQGKVTAARDAAREGLNRFARSAELRDILRSTWKRSGRNKVELLRESVSKDPSLGNFVHLIEYLREFDETDLAAEVSLEMVNHHPESHDAHVLAGKVFVSRFHRDHVAHDGSTGLRCLQRAVELETTSFHAHLALAQAYYYIGAVSKGLFHLYQAMDIQPENEEANELYKVLVRLPLEKEEETELLREVEENDEARFGDSEATSALPRATGGGVMSTLEQLSMVAGVKRVVLSHRGLDAVVKDGRRQPESTEETHRLLEMATGFRRTASLSAKRMGIGAFEEAEMTWDDTTLMAFGSGRTVLMIETERRQRRACIAEEARNFLAASIVPDREPAHA